MPTWKKSLLARAAAFSAAATGSLALVAPAHAALDEAVTTAMAALKTDVGTLAASAFAVALVIVAYRYFRRST